MTRVADGHYEAIYMAPEFISVDNENFMKLLRSDVLRNRIIGLIADEGHSIHNW